jgi:hypothetical protein
MKDWFDGKTKLVLVHLGRKSAISGRPFYAGIAKKKQVCVTSIEFQLFCLWKATGSDYFLSHRRLHRVSIGCRLLSILLFLYGLCVYILRVQHNLLNHSKYMWPPSKTFVLRFCWNFMFARRRNMISLLMTACLMTTTTNCKSNLSKFKVSIFGRFWSVTII